MGFSKGWIGVGMFAGYYHWLSNMFKSWRGRCDVCCPVVCLFSGLGFLFLGTPSVG